MTCSKCGKEIPNSVKFCTHCGAEQEHTKFCGHCGEKIDVDCVVCPKCGKQLEELKKEVPATPQVVINNTNTNTNTNVAPIPGLRLKKKWTSFFLCLFLGFLGAHKFYEGKIGMGILYLFTGGLALIGVTIDLIVILFKPKLYY